MCQPPLDIILEDSPGKIFWGKTDTREGDIRTTEPKVGKGPPRKGGELTATSLRSVPYSMVTPKKPRSPWFGLTN